MTFTLQKCTQAGARILAETMEADLARREARTIMRHVLNLSEHEYFAHADDLQDRRQFRTFAQMIRRRASGEPFSYITGMREFFSVNFIVNRAVLIPRPETEELVELVLRETRGKDPRILDIGTGSGCIAAVLALQCPQASITATDISAEALDTARQNLAELGLENRIRLIKSDLLDAFSDDVFDLIVSNPPYILEEEFPQLARDVRDFEPRSALVVEEPGPFFRRFFAQCRKHLIENGIVFLESNPVLIAEQGRYATEAGFEDIRIERDLSGRQRFLIAR